MTGQSILEIKALFTLMKDHSASDLHLACQRLPMIRIDGLLQPLTNHVVLTRELISNMLKVIMTKEQYHCFISKLEIDFCYAIENIGRFRINAYHDYYGPSLACRMIANTIPTLKALQLPVSVEQLCHSKHGLILVTGATGCGKSTTLAAMINAINYHYCYHIITLEDPIEFHHFSNKCLITQRQIGNHSRSFKKALQSMLRQDPDVILVGEMRDLTTVRLALQAAQAGHLVLSTLHTHCATATINRIIDLFPAGEKALVLSILSQSLRAVVSQQLLPKVGGGRIACCEIMTMTPAISNMIAHNKTAQINSAIQTGQAYGMMTLAQHCDQLIAQNLIANKAAQ